MAQSYTGNVNLVMNAIDNVTEATVFNHQVVAVASVDLQATFTALIVGTTPYVLYGPGNAAGLYVKNIGSTGTISISWDIGSGLTSFDVLQPGQFMLSFLPISAASTGNILQVQLTGSTSSQPVEAIVWA